MKSFYLFTFFFFLNFLTVTLNAQNCSLFSFNSESVSYDSVYFGSASNRYLDSIQKIGFYTTHITKKEEDPCRIYFEKGAQYKRIYLEGISLKNRNTFFDPDKNKYYTLEFDSYLNALKDSLEKAGKPFSEIRVTPAGFVDEFAVAKIETAEDSVRFINDINFVGYEKIPKFVKKEILRQNLPYSLENLEKIRNQIGDYSFLNQYDTPKISFTKDSTTLYIYVKKQKQSFFDGLVGFESDEDGKFSIQGNVLVNLLNAFNRFEKINLQWESGLNASQNLNFGLHVPYILNTRLGINSALNIQKQDTSFVRLQLRNGLVYQFNPNHYLGGTFNLASSNYIESSNVNQGDYSKNGFGISYFFEDNRPSVFRENKTLIHVTSGLWKRKRTDLTSDKTEQTEIIYQLLRQQKIWKEHYLFSTISGSNLIQEDDYLENDMYLTGGFNSVRGFNQNSILTSSFNMLTLAYRYIPSEQILFEAFTDFAFINSQAEDETETLNSVGAGMQFFTRFGIFQINYAVGKTSDTSFDLGNGKIHLGVKSYF